LATTNTFSDLYKYALQTKQIGLSADTIKVRLMRHGFVFDPAAHREGKNIATNSGAIALTWASGDKSVSRASGSFITDGFVVGNQCTSDDTSNPGPFTIATVTALKITFNEAVTDSSATKTLTSNDELATGYGYTQDTATTGTVTVKEDNTNHRSDATFPTVTWNASGGDIGPTPGAIFYDSTADVVIMYALFDVEKTASNGNPFSLGGGDFRES
jgi:hypothetical protein